MRHEKARAKRGMTMKEKRKAIEFRAITTDDGKLRKITGYAAVFGKASEDMGFVEYIEKGAFREALKKSDARALFNHDTDTLPLGRQSAGTLTLREDDTGLYFEITPPDTQQARDLMTSIDRGDIKEASFGFSVDEDKWDYSDKITWKRTITKIREIYDISPVVFAAYNDTTVALRKMEEAKKTAGPLTDEAERADDPSISLELLKEEDETYRKIKGIKEVTP